MKKIILYFAVIATAFLTSCKKEELKPEQTLTEQTKSEIFGHTFTISNDSVTTTSGVNMYHVYDQFTVDNSGNAIVNVKTFVSSSCIYNSSLTLIPLNSTFSMHLDIHDNIIEFSSGANNCLNWIRDTTVYSAFGPMAGGFTNRNSMKFSKSGNTGTLTTFPNFYFKTDSFKVEF
jgi:hypothetical protein